MSDNLRPLPTLHDLPPKWDGTPIEWREWSHMRTSLAYHAKAHELACDKCGAIDEKSVSMGKRGDLCDLVAFRCRHCLHDQVLDQRTEQTWDLDPQDYEDGGSWEEGVLF